MNIISMPSLEIMTSSNPSIILEYSGPRLVTSASACFAERFDCLGIVLLLGRPYLIVEFAQMAIVLRFRFIAANDLDDVLSIRLC
jgi:hypothetical protein